MITILFAFIAFIGWGSGDVFGGLVSRKIKGYSAAFWLFIFTFLMSSLLVPFFWNEIKLISLSMFFLIIILNLFGTIPMIALYEGLRVGNASLVGTITASFAALTVIFSVIFLGDRLSLLQTIPIIIIFIGLILSSLNLKSFNIKNILTDKGIIYGLIAMFSWGIYYTFIRIPIREIGWFWPSYFCFVSIPLILIYMRFKKIKLQKLSNPKIFLFSFLSSLFTSGAAYAYNFAVMKGQTAIVAPIAGSYPVFFVILSRLIFKDKITKQQFIGIVIALLGIVSLSFLST